MRKTGAAASSPAFRLERTNQRCGAWFDLHRRGLFALVHFRLLNVSGFEPVVNRTADLSLQMGFYLTRARSALPNTVCSIAAMTAPDRRADNMRGTRIKDITDFEASARTNSSAMASWSASPAATAAELGVHAPEPGRC